MKKNAKLIMLGVLLVIVVAIAAVLYPKLVKQYQSDAAPAEVKDTVEKAEDTAEKAVNFTVYDANNNAISLSDMIGKPTIVNFWTTWCIYCLEELPMFNQYAEKYKNQINFMMVDLPDGYRETVKKALAFVEKEGYSFPVYFDLYGSASNSYRIQSIPVTLLIDKNGSLYKIHIGLMNEAILKQYIEILTQGTH